MLVVVARLVENLVRLASVLVRNSVFLVLALACASVLAQLAAHSSILTGLLPGS
jgi:hypothetical protein